MPKHIRRVSPPPLPFSAIRASAYYSSVRCLWVQRRGVGHVTLAPITDLVHQHLDVAPPHSDNDGNDGLIPHSCFLLRCYSALLIWMKTRLDDKDDLCLAMPLTVLAIILVSLMAAAPAIRDAEAYKDVGG
jgi:hypothetical protein